MKTIVQAAPSEEERILLLLAQYDAQGVDDHKIRAIFNCNAANLAEARQQDFYSAALAEAQNLMLDKAINIDTAWDNAEATSVKQLVDLMEFNADPRLSLLVAARANQASRRMAANPLRAVQSKGGHNNQSATIDPQALAGPTRTVRVRTKFAEILQDRQGINRLVAREVEITSSDTVSIDENMSPARLKGLMQTALGVNMDEVVIDRRSHPTDYGLNGVIDFAHFIADGGTEEGT